MTELTLLDAAVLVFIVFSVVRGRSRTLGDSLHGLIALLLVIGLFLSFRLASELRLVLGGLGETMRAIPGLGSKLLIIVAAWYLMRLLRRQSGLWIEKVVPSRLHGQITPISEGLRAALLAGFLVWLAEGLFEHAGPGLPKVVHAVRAGDAWLEGQLNPSPAPPATRPYPGHPPFAYPRR
jgi:hypothetical protein